MRSRKGNVGSRQETRQENLRSREENVASRQEKLRSPQENDSAGKEDKAQPRELALAQLGQGRESLRQRGERKRRQAQRHTVLDQAYCSTASIQES